LFSAKVIPDPSSLHVVDQYVDVARAAGAVCDRAEFHLWPTPESLVRVRNLLNEHGVFSKFVVANAGAGWPTKRWPATHFAELSRMLHEMKIPVVFIGAKSAADVDAMREVQAAGAEHAINLLGKTSVHDLIALVALAAAHVGGDTGSSHIAAALGKPAVGLYSITRPERTCPYGQIERCLYDPRGLAQISVDAALDKVKEALS
jgi:ADP-heptose:LPS heptosyltransferase